MRSERAVVFCRVSTAPQAKKWSLPSQLQFNKEYARKNGLHIVREYSIAELGHSSGHERKIFKGILELIRSDGLRYLIVLNVEHLSRDFRGMVDLDDLTREFLCIHFTESGETIEKDTSGDKRAFWAIKVVFARPRTSVPDR